MSKKRIMIVDDAAMMRLVIRNMLSNDPNLQITGFADNGQDAQEGRESYRDEACVPEFARGHHPQREDAVPACSAGVPGRRWCRIGR